MNITPQIQISKNSVDNNEICSNCGMTQSEWKGNNGKGFQIAYKLYCCQGCATHKGCTCK